MVFIQVISFTKLTTPPERVLPPVVISSMLIRMDKFNVGTADDKIKKSAITVPTIRAHVSLDLNENQFGIHPRYIVGRLDLTASSSECNGGNTKRFVKIPVLTIEQFLAFNKYVPNAAEQKPHSSIKVNHSYSGNGFAVYNIMRKIPQTLI